MSTNKKIFFFTLCLLLLVFSVTVVDASVLVGAHGYVGENICSEDSIKRILKLVGILIIIVKIVVPLLLMVLGSIDLFQAIVGKDGSKDLSKSLKTFVLRVVLGIFIFFVPSIVNVVFDIYYDSINEENNNECVTCVLDIDNC